MSSEGNEQSERFERWNEIGHVIDPAQHDLEWLDERLFPIAAMYKGRVNKHDWSVGRIFRDIPAIANFQEPSTRTFISSANAAQRLGARVLPQVGAEFSSLAKGESISDMMEMIEGNRFALSIIRFAGTGDAAIAGDILTTPLINAGDGKGHHPTQSYLDWFTLRDRVGELRDKKYVIGGDLLRGRTVRSLANLFAQLGDVELLFVSREGFQIDDDLRANLDGKVDYSEEVIADNGDYVVPGALLEGAAATYWTRTQLERSDNSGLTAAPRDIHQDFLNTMHGEKVDPIEQIYQEILRLRQMVLSTTDKPVSPWDQPELIINGQTMEELKSETFIMHPLPRIRELDIDIDDDPRAIHFEQAGNGLPVRMALIHLAMKQRWPDRFSHLR